VVKEVDWLSGLSEGKEVRQELELVVVGDGGSGGSGVSPEKETKKKSGVRAARGVAKSSIVMA
jgi:hypothetical protein